MQSGVKQFYFSFYFIINVLLMLAYPILRIFTSAGKRSLKSIDSFGFSYQNSIIYTVLIMAVMGYARSTSLRGFFVDLFAVGKVGIAALLIFAKFKFSIIYIIACVIAWLITPYPKFKGKNKFINISSIEQFDQIMDQYKKYTSPNIGKNKSNNKNNIDNEQANNIFNYQDKYMIFIQFYADWVMPCILNKQLWYSYSLKYTTQRLKFVQVNVDKFPQLAKKFKINISGFSKQLPTILMVTNGQQQVRFPPIQQNNKVSKVQKYDYKALLRYFDLEARYLETRTLNVKNQEERNKQRLKKQV